MIFEIKADSLYHAVPEERREQFVKECDRYLEDPNAVTSQYCKLKLEDIFRQGLFRSVKGIVFFLVPNSPSLGQILPACSILL